MRKLTMQPKSPKAKKQVKAATPKPKAARKLPGITKAAKPKAARKPVKAAKPAKAAKPVSRAKPSPDHLSGRRAETLRGNRYPFGKINANDESYLAFYYAQGCRHNHAINLAVIQRETPTNPYYPGNASNASSNLGYVNRLRKAGYLAADCDSHTVTFNNTEAEAYAKARHAKLR